MIPKVIMELENEETFEKDLLELRALKDPINHDPPNPEVLSADGDLWQKSIKATVNDLTWSAPFQPVFERPPKPLD